MFCLSARSVNGILSLCNNIRPVGNKSVRLDPQLEIITAAEKEEVIAKKSNIDMDRLIVNYKFFFLFIQHGHQIIFWDKVGGKSEE